MNFQQIIQLPNKLGTTFKLLTSRFNKIGDKIKNYEMPEKIKNTFVERWGKLKITNITVILCIMQ